MSRKLTALLFALVVLTGAMGLKTLVSSHNTSPVVIAGGGGAPPPWRIGN
jgi:hypothetical protein